MKSLYEEHLKYLQGRFKQLEFTVTKLPLIVLHFIPEELVSVVPHHLVSLPIILITAVEGALADDTTCARSHIQLIISTSASVRDQNNDSLGPGSGGSTRK